MKLIEVQCKSLETTLEKDGNMLGKFAHFWKWLLVRSWLRIGFPYFPHRMKTKLGNSPFISEDYAKVNTLFFLFFLFFLLFKASQYNMFFQPSFN